MSRFNKNCDSPETIHQVLRLYRQSLALPGAYGALEIGVSRGGFSAQMAEIAPPNFIILGVDPYGKKPFPLGDRVLQPNVKETNWDGGFGDSYYTSAKRILADFPNHAIFLMESIPFLRDVLPCYRFWRNGNPYPPQREFLSFAFIDGEHTKLTVLLECELLFYFLVKGAIICVDNLSFLGEIEEELTRMGYKSAGKLPPDRGVFIKA